MKNKGIFSIEAAAALATLAVLLLSLGAATARSGAGLHDIQKAQDLLIIWARNGSPMEEMESDAELVFGKDNFRIEMDGRISGSGGRMGIMQEIRTAERGTIRLFVRG